MGTTDGRMVRSRNAHGGIIDASSTRESRLAQLVRQATPPGGDLPTYTSVRNLLEGDGKRDVWERAELVREFYCCQMVRQPNKGEIWPEGTARAVRFWEDRFHHPLFHDGLLNGQELVSNYLDEDDYPLLVRADGRVTPLPEMVRPYFSTKMLHAVPWVPASLDDPLALPLVVIMHWLHALGLELICERDPHFRYDPEAAPSALQQWISVSVT